METHDKNKELITLAAAAGDAIGAYALAYLTSDQFHGALRRMAENVLAELARQRGVAEDGFRIVSNTNAGAGQTVYHIHFHLLAGRKLTWPPG